MFNMKLILLTAFVLSSIFQSTYCSLPKKDFGENLARDSVIWHKKCVILTDITEDQINELIDGVFKEDDKQAKKYLSCLWLVSGAIDMDFKLNKEKLVYYLPPAIPNAANGASYIKCGEQAYKKGDNFEEKIWELMKCNHKNNPDTYIIF